MKQLTVLLLALFFVVQSQDIKAQTNFRQITYQEALAAAKAENKPIFIDFYTAWCGPCKMMAKNIFPQVNVGDFFNATFVCIKLDAEKEGAEQAKKFKVQAYPTMIAIDCNENVIFTKVGANLDPEAFVAEVKTGINPELTPEKMKAKYESGDRSAELVSAYANHLCKEAMESRRPDQAKIAEAQKIVDDYYASLTDAQRLEEKNFFVYSYNYCNEAKDVKAQFLVNNKDKFPAERQKAVSETIEKLLTWYMGNCLGGAKAITSSDVDILESEVKTSGINADGKYTPTFRVLRAQLQGDEAYIAQLQKDWKKLCDSDQFNIAMGMNNNIKSDNKDTLTKADKFLRAQLENLDATGIFYAAESLIQLERRINGESGH